MQAQSLIIYQTHYILQRYLANSMDKHFFIKMTQTSCTLWKDWRCVQNICCDKCLFASRSLKVCRKVLQCCIDLSLCPIRCSFLSSHLKLPQKKHMLAKLENTIILLVGPPKFCIRIVFSFSWDLQWFQEKTQTTLIQNLGGQTEYYGVFRFNQLEIYVSLSLKPTASNFTMKIPTLLAKKTWPRHSYSVCILIISGWLEKYMYKPNCVEHVSR